MRLTAFALIAGILPGTLIAQEAALLMGNETYESLGAVQGAADVRGAAGALSAAGVEVVSITDAEQDDMIAAMERFFDLSEGAEAQLVVLSGRFVGDGGTGYFLGTEAAGNGPLDGIRAGVPLESLMRPLERTAGRSIMLLAPAGGIEALANLETPFGVAAILTSPDRVEGIVADVLAEPGAPLGDLAGEGVRVLGLRSATASFLPAGRGGTPVPDAEAGDSGDRSAWIAARSAGDVAGYRGYLDSYPSGIFADIARARLADLDSPAARAERAEGALNLGAEARQDVQSDLVVMGYDTRGIDGIFGSGTRAAIASWQGQNDFDETGFLTRDQIGVLDVQAERRQAVLEEERRVRLAEIREAEDAYWQETGAGESVQGLLTFLERYPDGNRAADARQRLAVLQAEAGSSDAEAMEREAQLWRAVQQANTVEAYNQFLSAFPDGPYADQARQAITRLETGFGVPQSDEEAAAAGVEASLGLNPVTRQAVETRLAALGLEPGPVDGTFDSQTRQALRQYQEGAGLPRTGYMDQVTAVRLMADAVRDLLR